MTKEDINIDVLILMVVWILILYCPNLVNFSCLKPIGTPAEKLLVRPTFIISILYSLYLCSYVSCCFFFFATSLSFVLLL